MVLTQRRVKSMEYNGVTIREDNFRQIFQDVDEDVLDEIRLAVLDNVNIMEYIDACGDDSYKLGQIRLALRNGVPSKYIRHQMTAKTLKCVRIMYKSEVELRPLSKYIGFNKLLIDSDLFEIITECYMHGGDIGKIDFSEVLEDNVQVLCQGLVRGYPMWLMTSKDLSAGYIRLLMRGIDLGIDVSIFIKDIMSESQLVTLLSNAGSVDINNLLQYINSKFSLTALKTIIQAYKESLDFELLTYQSADGYPIYNEYQMMSLLKALRLKKKGFYVDDVFNPLWSDFQMDRLLEKYSEI